MRPWLVSAAAGALTLLIVGVPGTGRATGETPRSCGWEARFDATAANTLYPDQAANYWLLQAPAAPGTRITVHGLYPHARYISFTTYDAALRAVDGANDQAIAPDPGSVNVFAPGAPRSSQAVPDDAHHRGYTVHVVFGRRPSSPAPNTVYTTSADGTLSAQDFNVVYRLYRPDRQYASVGDISGGVGLPSVTYETPGGHALVLPDCPYPTIPDTGVNQRYANSGSASSSPLLGYPGTNPPTYHRFYNAPTSVAQAGTDNGYTGTRLGQAGSRYTTRLPKGGYLQNLDNAYVFAQLTHGYGNIAVVHGRLPTTPATYDGEPVMGTGQLRYWSLCTNDAPTERYYGCLNDDQLHPDAGGSYTIVISTAAARPANATAACGTDWVPWGPGSSTLIIVRNMLPDPSFVNAIQNVAVLGTERAVMGSYYPTTRYTDGAHFSTPLCPHA